MKEDEFIKWQEEIKKLRASVDNLNDVYTNAVNDLLNRVDSLEANLATVDDRRERLDERVVMLERRYVDH